MTFPYLIFRKVCYFCRNFDHEAHECIFDSDKGDDSPACDRFQLSEEFARFLDVNIFTEVEEAWKRREVVKEVR
ncbi:hypothetical protein [Archaeoglobus profundus]|uniref:Uncharacterized protein n=1 Tax=Archaeoglobus profundus (strain DSM 5631 / JCM 9629 / NBRC 100127 / Av18) TaxID=572546 RepID=D2RI43_ARCPA|nr:hypothetical protein [Archaeoglobus profundus]ADB57968.1 hypothetical protein Arcpr_0907 [Archaeoglobus profundus DSM 5631]